MYLPVSISTVRIPGRGWPLVKREPCLTCQRAHLEGARAQQSSVLPLPRSTFLRQVSHHTPSLSMSASWDPDFLSLYAGGPLPPGARVGLVFDKLLMALRPGVRSLFLVSIACGRSPSRRPGASLLSCTLLGGLNIIVDGCQCFGVTIRSSNILSSPIVPPVRVYRNM